jgi:hypothetical protein
MSQQNQLAVIGDSLEISTMDQAIAFSSKMAEAKLLPAHLQKSPADCLRVVIQASKWRMDPFAVADKTSVINGKLNFEGQLISAVINARGNLVKRLDYSFSGQGDARVLTVSGTIKGESEPRTIELPFSLAKRINKNGQMNINPDQQATYIGARIWARRHMSELLLGVYAPDEMPDDDEPKNVTPGAEGEPASGPGISTETTAKRRGRPPGRSATGAAAVVDTEPATVTESKTIDVQATATADAQAEVETPKATEKRVKAASAPTAEQAKPVTSLSAGEKKSFAGVMVVEIVAQNFGTVEKPRLAVKASVEGAFTGLVYDTRIGSAEWVDAKDPAKGVKAALPWQLDHPINLVIVGKKRPDETIANVVESAELSEGAVQEAGELP